MYGLPVLLNPWGYRVVNDRYYSQDCAGALSNGTVKAKKSLGQHFLKDVAVRDLIIDAARLTPKDTIVEVGPGLGVLTSKLLAAAGNVIAIEIDERLFGKLQNHFKSSENIKIINGDILSIEPEKIVGDVKDYKVVANLPYYITSPVLHHFIQAVRKPSLMVVMIQKEVADAIAGKNGRMTALGVTMRIYCQPERIAVVPPCCFSPPPKVNSAVVRFNMLTEPAISSDMIPAFIKTVRNGFCAPRKQLRNSLAYGMNISAELSEKILDKAGIDWHKRAEMLSMEQWQRLTEVVHSGVDGCD